MNILPDWLGTTCTTGEGYTIAVWEKNVKSLEFGSEINQITFSKDIHEESWSTNTVTQQFSETVQQREFTLETETDDFSNVIIKQPFS